ncbi:hypothetical protein D3C87_35390 [compost metagenome]
MVFLFFFLIGIFIMYTFLKEKRDDRLLENSVEHFAILIEINGGNAHSPSSGDFKYKVNNEEYEFNQSGDYKFMQVGDTVLIEYAVEDHSVARVVDKYYMNKYK